MKDKLIAVVGVSSNPEKYGYKIFKDLIDSQYDVIGINPSASEILGREVYHSLSECKRKIELVIVVVPPQIGLAVLKECHQLGINEVWLQPGAESDELLQYGKDNGMTITSNACFMKGQKLW